MTCRECGAELPEHARFCLECGISVWVNSPAHELRKTVTLLFTDVEGSTVLGEQLDPEAYRAVMGRYFNEARAAVERHGGTVEKFVGDAVLAVFGIPEVHEDDALRGVRAAAEIRSAVLELSHKLDAESGVRLHVRIGVNTGQVVAGSARSGGSFATGDAVNTAARLEQAAPPGEVLLGATTYELVRDAVRVDPVAHVAAKGKAEPLQAYRLISVRDAPRGRTRRFEGPLVGRERESRALIDTLDRAVALERGHLVTVLGPPGMGKTRLVNDFVKDIGDRAEVVSGRCVSYGQGITYWPVVQLLREAMHLQGEESSAVTRDAIDELLAGAADRARVGELLLALLGKDTDPGSKEETFWAIRRAVEQLAARRPLVVALDDLHWGEPTLLELIEHLRDEVRDLPLLLVCQARPELLDVRPAWGGGSLNSVTFALEPLTAAETALSLSDLLDGPVVPEVAVVVADWAGGNPLFVEEVVAHLLERKLLVRSDDGWRLAGDLATVDVPPTVAALLAARLERLPLDERTLAERMSVVGLELTEEDALVLADTQDSGVLRDRLAALARRDMLRRRRTQHGEVWAFKHILVRDAAYESLPKALRADLHERYAQHVATSDDEAAGAKAAFVAHHLEQAVRNRRELGEPPARLTALTVKTAHAFTEAGEQARDRLDFPAATSLLQRAAALQGLPRATRQQVTLRLLRLLFVSNQIEVLGEVLAELVLLLDEGGSEADAALLGFLRLWHQVNRGDPVDPAVLLAAGDHAVSAGEDDDELVLSLVLTSRIDALTTLGQWSKVGQLADEIAGAGGLFERRQAEMYRVASLIHGEAPLSDLSGALAQLREEETRSPFDELLLVGLQAVRWAALGDARANDSIVELLRQHELQERPGPLIYASFAQQLMGDVNGAIGSLRRMATLAEALGDLSHVSTHLGLLACLELARGDPQATAEQLAERAASMTSPHDTASVGLVATARSMLAGRAGDHERAAEEGARAVATMRRGDQLWETADVLRFVALAMRWCQDSAAERDYLQQALELYLRKKIVYWSGVVERRLNVIAQAH